MATGLELIRQTLAAEVEACKATFTAYPLQITYDNRFNVDLQKVAKPFLSVEIEFVNGSQMDLSNKPIHLIQGLLLLTAKCREGDGTTACYSLLESFYPKLQGRGLPGALRTDFSTFSPPVASGGWWAVSALIPFRSHLTRA